MKPRTHQPLPFDTSLDPALAALHAACNGRNDIQALRAAVAQVEPDIDEGSVWSMLDELATMGCLEQAAAPPVDRGVTRRSLFRGLAFGAAAAAAVVAVRPARAQALAEGEFALEEELGVEEEGLVCSPRSLKAGGQREAQQKRVRSEAAEQREKATRRFEEQRIKAEASGDREAAAEARRKFAEERDAIREEAAKAREYQPRARRQEQEAKQRMQRLGMDRTWKSESGVGHAPGFLSVGDALSLEGEVNVLRTTFVEKEGSCGGLRVSFHFRSRKGELPPEDLAAQSFTEIYRTLQSLLMKGDPLGATEITVAWGLDEGLAYTGIPSDVSFSFTAWDESGEPCEGAVRLLLS